ncbi:AcfA family outer membrane beta-barrel protein [Alteromonas sp. 1_MG-2023]|uniref:AcfA family outer membrane beta-barrel protein n=1 Tax=Alteromonas sp. 1_MG-2023 TaxID=3062669 RepID=UPI0026E1C216|nr:AcfA family outer membrane beta-barrel protein [Alteromonas sp. 1_MG-2023]MDO6475163.1 AcfA family outer membrane beta-barrel protein [Alteromonas sp. 1_MG-2023]
MNLRNTFTLLALTTVPAYVTADPFIAAGMGYNSIELEDDQYDFALVDGVQLDVSSDDSDTAPWLQLGYTFSPAWSIALTYNQFETGSSQEVVLSALEEEEWEASLDVTEYALEAIWHYSLADKWQLNTSAGIVLHDADFSQSHELDVENGADVVYSAYGESDSKVGAVASVGIEYAAYRNFSVVANTRFSYSSLVSNASANVGVKYAF